MIRKHWVLVAGVIAASQVVCATGWAQQTCRVDLSVREPGVNFFSGERVTRTVVVRITGGEGDLTNVTVDWRLAVGHAVVQRDSFNVPGSARPAQRTITLHMPEVRRVVRGSLSLSAVRDGRRLGAGRYGLMLLPRRPPVPAILKDAQILLVDPSGRTAAALDSLGLGYGKASGPRSETLSAADLVILGSGIPEARLARFLAELENTVSAGGVALCMAQADFDKNCMPHIVLEDAGKYPQEWAQPVGSHPLQGDLPEGDLGRWRPDGRSVRRAIRAPATGNFRILLDVTVSDDAGGVRAAVLEVPYGKGRFLFSQLLIAERFLEEPVARYALVNLLVHALSPRKRERAKTPVLAAGLLVLRGGQGAIIVCQLPLPSDENDTESLRTFSQLLTGLNPDAGRQEIH